MVILIFCVVFSVVLKRIARAQNTFEVRGNASAVNSNWTCSHQYDITYAFDNYFLRNGAKIALEGNQVFKCEQVTVALAESGLWFGGLTYTSGGGAACGSGGACGSGAACGGCACACCACACGACGPPADFINCVSIDSCLNSGTLRPLDTEGNGKGVVSNPVFPDLVKNTQNGYFNCSGHQCTAYASGNYSFTEGVNATNYYGQCRDGTITTTVEIPKFNCKCDPGGCEPGYGCWDPFCKDTYSGNTCDPKVPNPYTCSCQPGGCDEYGNCWDKFCRDNNNNVCDPDAKTTIQTTPSPVINLGTYIPAQTNLVSYAVVNRPPQVSDSFSQPIATPSQEVSVTCRVTDPDCAGDPVHADKASRIKWSCADQQGNNTGCHFSKGGGVWRTGALTEDLQNMAVSNPFESTVKFKASNSSAYSVTCEAWDNDALKPMSSKGRAQIDIKEQTDNPNIEYCSILHETGERNRTVCVSSDPGSSAVGYKAYLSGIDPQQYETYRWKCSPSDSAEETGVDTKQCVYGYQSNADNTYVPSLTMVDKETGKEIPCNSTISTKVTCIAKCSVLAKESGTSNDYASSTVAPINAGVEGKVKKQCLNEGKTTWNVVGGSLSSSNDFSMKAKIDNPNVAQMKIQAQISKGGVITGCDEAVVEIKDKMKWGR